MGATWDIRDSPVSDNDLKNADIHDGGGDDGCR